ncbi:MAG: CDP-alcohol phosphatidyltransferase family protein [Nitrospirae bacterium]|nr:CDP-alcohol phosphatidyltransferase family protein [Nitrospirota bacterium]
MANLITVFRILLLFVGVVFIYSRTFAGEITAVLIILTVIFLDGVDGLVARSRNAVTPFGAMMDILGDRIVENTLWIVFAHVHLIPVWVPIVVVIRGFITDSLRGVALTHGKTPFGKETMIRGRIGRFLVSSRLSRAVYAVAKVCAFCALILYLAYLEAVPLYGPAWEGWGDLLYGTAMALVYITVFFCVVRAVPVVISGYYLIQTRR